MKKLSNYLMLFLAAGLLAFSGCSDDSEDPVDNNDNNTMESTIVDVAMQDTSLSILVAALQSADLVDALKADGDKTVFAPDNDAFRALLASNPDWNSLEDIDADLLKNVLMFHVVGSKIMSTDLSNTYVSTLATGPNDEAISLQVDVDGGVTFNGAATPLATDIAADNGVIHKINSVMLPPNVVSLASNNSSFSILVSALMSDSLQTDFLSILGGDGPFTIFAPNDAAFVALLESNQDWNELSDIPAATLEAVLAYHVVNGANVQSDELTDAQTIKTIGGDLTTDLSSGAALKTSSDQTVNIIGTDVQGTNGVIHIVEEVLIP